MLIKYISNSPIQTKNLAKKIAKKVKTGYVLGLVGELGSGKTQFVKGLAEYFGIKKSITSPTFVLIRPYNIPRLHQLHIRTHQEFVQNKLKKLIHVDCYRLDNPQELLDIGINEYLKNSDYITIIEWADKIKTILPKDTKWIKFKSGKKENQRIIYVRSF